MKQNLLQQKKDTAYAVKSYGDHVVIKDVDLAKKIVTGFYNTCLYFDSDYDVILKGAADNSINQRGPNSTAVAKIKHLLFHDWTQLPGKIQLLEERTAEVNGKTVTGIYFETKMSETQLGIDTLINYQEAIYDNHSIGFRYLDGQWLDSEAEDWQKYVDMLINPEDAINAGFMYIWKEIMLWEGSTVAFGANQLTPYLGVKSEDKQAILLKLNNRMQQLTKQVQTGKQSDDMLQKFEMQLLQINQIVNELFTNEPLIKDTQLKGRLNTSTQENKGSFDVKQILSKI